MLIHLNWMERNFCCEIFRLWIQHFPPFKTYTRTFSPSKICMIIVFRKFCPKKTQKHLNFLSCIPRQAEFVICKGCPLLKYPWNYISYISVPPGGCRHHFISSQDGVVFGWDLFCHNLCKNCSVLESWIKNIIFTFPDILAIQI